MAKVAPTVRRSVSIPAPLAAKVHQLAKARRVSDNRMMVELLEGGLEAAKRKELEFRELAERFRKAKHPDDIQRLGDELGRMVFGG